MIDLHCHILPGIDDGAQTIDESLSIACQLHNAGFKTIIATPHVLEGKEYLSSQKILERTNEINQALSKEGLDLEVIPGAECYIFPDLPKWVAQDKIMTLGNMKKYILVELPMLEVPSYTEKVFFDLQVMGITPILAHPERNKELSETTERLLEWARKGVLLQLDLRSVDGRYGEKVSQFAQLLLKNQLIHFIGSDAHRTARENAYQKSLEVLLDIVGNEEFEQVSHGLPDLVLRGEKIDSERDYKLIQPKGTRSQGLWKKIWLNFFSGNAKTS